MTFHDYLDTPYNSYQIFNRLFYLGKYFTRFSPSNLKPVNFFCQNTAKSQLY